MCVTCESEPPSVCAAAVNMFTWTEKNGFFSQRSCDRNIWLIKSWSTDDLRGNKAILKGTWIQQERDSPSLQQMATCAGRKKMVFSFLRHVCQPPSVCCFRSPGRDLFTTLACCQCFPLCLILEKQIWGCLAQNVLSAVCITLRKQKVFKIALHYYRYLPFSALWALSLYLFLFSNGILSVALDDSQAIWLSLKFGNYKWSSMLLCCETPG